MICRHHHFGTLHGRRAFAGDLVHVLHGVIGPQVPHDITKILEKIPARLGLGRAPFTR